MTLLANTQMSSPLLRLPGEIRNKIYLLALTTPEIITDPSPCFTIRSPHHSIPSLGVPLLRTCRAIFNEACPRPLYALNRFRFTAVTFTHLFLSSLAAANAALIQDLEIDVKEVHDQHPGLSQEWKHYLSWSTGIWAQKVGCLRADAPGVRVLRLNFEAWPRIGVSRRHLWDMLRRLVLNLEGLGLERCVVVGASKGEVMARREPWSPVHFVGADDLGDEEGGNFDLVKSMWGAVGCEETEKVVKWTRSEGMIELEVVLVSHIRKTNRSWAGTPIMGPRDPWPQNGTCDWQQYQERNGEGSIPLGFKPVNPNVFV